MSGPDSRRLGTETVSTQASTDEPAVARSDLGLAVVIECERIAAGGGVFPLAGRDRIVFRRGDRRRLLPGTAGNAVLELPDPRVSSDHAALERVAGGGFRLVDLGSSNGTHVGSERITARVLSPGELFRIGRTLLCLVGDASAAAEHARAPWPFPTSSGTLAAAFARLARVAPTTIPVLLLGETGTGKEVVARAIHERSARPGAFVAVNCGALPAHLVEAQLFGHLKGSFSGASTTELGFVRSADHGTLLLDEIGDLPASAQTALLRFLQEGEVTPVGAFRPVKVDVRVLSATHRPIEAMIAEEAFRSDLYARLAGFTFRLPPMRERREDLGHLLAAFAAGAESLSLRHEVALALYKHSFPLNVRELGKVFDAARVLARDGVIRAADLADVGALEAGVSPAKKLSPAEEALRVELSERLAVSNRNLTQVAREMGKARQQIQRWVKRFGL